MKDVEGALEERVKRIVRTYNRDAHRKRRGGTRTGR